MSIERCGSVTAAEDSPGKSLAWRVVIAVAGFTLHKLARELKLTKFNWVTEFPAIFSGSLCAIALYVQNWHYENQLFRVMWSLPYTALTNAYASRIISWLSPARGAYQIVSSKRRLWYLTHECCLFFVRGDKRSLKRTTTWTTVRYHITEFRELGRERRPSVQSTVEFF